MGLIMFSHWFLSPQHHGKTMINLRRRLYTTVVTCLIISISIIGTYFFWISYDTPPIAKLVASATLVFLALYTASLIAMQRTNHYQLIGHFTIFWSVCVLFFSICFLGGGLNTASTIPMVLVVIAMSFLILGFHGGLCWAIVVAAGFSILLYMAKNEINFPRITDASPTQNDLTLAWVLALLTLGLLFIAYEWVLYKLSKEHGGQKSTFFNNNTADHFLTSIINDEDILIYLEQALLRNKHYNDKVSVHYIILPNNADKLIGTTINKKIYERSMTLARSTDLILRNTSQHLIAIYENITSIENHQFITSELSHRLKEPLYYDGRQIEMNIELHSILFPDDVDNAKRLYQKLKA